MYDKIKWFFSHFEYIISMICSGCMITLLFVQVVARYVLKNSLPFTEEIAVILFIVSVYFGAIGATRRNQHLKIELLTSCLSPKNQTVCKIFSNIMFVIVNGFLMYGSCMVVSNLYSYGMVTAITRLPKWIPYMVICFALVVISIRLIEDTVRQIRELKNTKAEETVS